MRRARACAQGLGLVEVLVALTVAALNLIGWTATLHVVLTLVRRIGELGAGPDPAVTASAACALALAVPRAPTSSRAVVRMASVALRRRAAHVSRRLGLSLVELLVALAVGSLVVAGLAATSAAGVGAGRGASVAADAATLRHALPALVGEVVEKAGGGMRAACGLMVAEGASLMTVRRAASDGTVVEEAVFAAIDAAGRPALYLRRLPHARQPWVEDVIAFRVERVDPASEPGATDRAERVSLLVEHAALDVPVRFDVPLPHRPCVEAPP